MLRRLTATNDLAVNNQVGRMADVDSILTPGDVVHLMSAISGGGDSIPGHQAICS